MGVQGWDFLKGLFEGMQSTVQTVLSTAQHPPAGGALILIALALVLLVGADMAGFVSIHGMVYGVTEQELQPFGRLNANVEMEDWLAGVQLVKAYPKWHFDPSPVLGTTLDRCREHDLDLEPYGIVWEPTLPGLSTVVRGILFGEEGNCAWLQVATVDALYETNGTWEGFVEELDDLVDMLENGEICNQTGTLEAVWGGMDISYSYDATKGAFVSDCWIPRNATTHERIPLDHIREITGASFRTTQYEEYDYLSAVLDPRTIVPEDIKFREHGMLTPLIIVDHMAEGTAAFMDSGVEQVFNVKVFVPLYTALRNLFVWLLFLSLCLLAVTIAHKASE